LIRECSSIGLAPESALERLRNAEHPLLGEMRRQDLSTDG
jgi:hypothetical protein